MDGGKISVEMGGGAAILDSKAEVSKLVPDTYYYEVIVPGLFPYEGEFTISDADYQEDIFIEIPPFLFYEDYERSGFPPEWTVHNPHQQYFAPYGGRIVYQKMTEEEDPVYFVFPKVAIDQGCVVSFKAGESSGPSNIAVGVISDPEDPGATYSEIVWITSGIDETIKEYVNIYPNPVVSNFTVKGITYGRLSLMDLEGKILKELPVQNETNVKINDLPDGIYIIRLDYNDTTKITKLVKTR